ncbi:hypothetical protein Dimus_015428 [Dionaea muscipula]
MRGEAAFLCLLVQGIAAEMACMKLGSKTDAFQRRGQAWFCTTGLPSDIVVEVGEMSFHLHKFPLLSRSGMVEKLIAEASEELELTASNVVPLCCAANHLEMTEDYGEGNLISQTEMFLNQVVLRSWKDSLRALQTCEDHILSYADQLDITRRCVESLAAKASSIDPNLFGWPVERGGPMQSPGGSVLWNGISTGARLKHSSSDWWYDDASTLSLPLFKRLISTAESRGIKPEIIAGSISFYAKRYLPGLNRRQSGGGDSTTRLAVAALGTASSEDDQKLLIQDIDRLLPFQKGIVSTKFLFGLLRTAMILRADPACISSLEKRIGVQLDQAALEDLLMPTFSYTMETLYNVECVQRILDHFLTMDHAVAGGGRRRCVPSTMAKVAPDINLKQPKFEALAAAIPEYARPLDDGLYRAIDIFLKSHPWLAESEREQLCRLMDCQKLSLEACTHAAQNERLPLRVIVQVLFFEQLQLRNSIAGCFLVSENLEGSRPLRSGGLTGPVEGGNWATTVRENQVLKLGMDDMRMRVSELEKECSNMKQEIEKLGRVKGSSSTAWGNVSKKLGFGFKSQMCSAQEGSVSNRTSLSGKSQKAKPRHGKHKKNL